MRKHVRARHERNRELGRIDAANRCDFCRRALPKHPFRIDVAGGPDLLYCNIDCRRDQLDAQGQGA